MNSTELPLNASTLGEDNTHWLGFGLAFNNAKREYLKQSYAKLKTQWDWIYNLS